MNPSYQHYATHDESEYPHLWRGVVGAWAPCLGPTGTRLHDHSGRANWGTLTNMDPETRWVVDRGQYALSFTGTTTGPGTVVKFSGVSLPESSGWSVSWWCWCNSFTTSGTFPSVFLLATEDGKGIKGFLNNNPSTYGPVSWGAFDNTWARLRADAASVSFLQVWRHVLITYNGQGKASSSSYRVYIDGVRYGVLSNAAYSSYANVNEWGGNNFANDAYTFDGYLDDMVVAYSVRSENEAREIFQIGRGGMYTPRRRRRVYSFGPFFQAAWARGSNVILQPCGVS